MIHTHTHIVRLLFSSLVLISLSILLVCDITEIMMNRSLILVIDVASNLCRWIEREKARQAHSRLSRNMYRSITSSGQYFFPRVALSVCSSRERLRTFDRACAVRFPPTRMPSQRISIMCISCF